MCLETYILIPALWNARTPLSTEEVPLVTRICEFLQANPYSSAAALALALSVPTADIETALTKLTIAGIVSAKAA